MKRLIISVILLQTTLFIAAQLHNGNYIQIPQVYVDGSITYEISHDSIIIREYSTTGIDSTIGHYKIEEKVLYVEWLKYSIPKEVTRMFMNPTQISPSDKIVIAVKDSRNNPIPAVTILRNSDSPLQASTLIGRTEGSGKLMIDRDSLHNQIYFSCIGHSPLQINVDTIATLRLDSMVVYLKNNAKRYQERKNGTFQILDLDKNGFVLIENVNQPTKYIKSTLYDTLVKEGIILRKPYYTKEEYQHILNL